MSEDELNRQRAQSEDHIIRLRKRKPEEALFHASVKSAELMKENRELKQRLSDVEKRAELADAVLKTRWEHRCKDGVGGCTAVSASALEKYEEEAQKECSDPNDVNYGCCIGTYENHNEKCEWRKE